MFIWKWNCGSKLRRPKWLKLCKMTWCILRLECSPLLKRSWDSYRTGVGNFSDVSRRYFFYLYSSFRGGGKMLLLWKAWERTFLHQGLKGVLLLTSATSISNTISCLLGLLASFLELCSSGLPFNSFIPCWPLPLCLFGSWTKTNTYLPLFPWLVTLLAPESSFKPPHDMVE